MLKYLLLLALAFPPLARADEATHRAAAEKVVDASDLAKGLQGMLPLMIAQLTQGMKAQGLSDDLLNEAKGIVTNWFGKEVKWQDVKPQVIEVFTKEFSEEELTQLLAFYQSPTGRKFLEKMPQAFQQTMQISQSYLQKKQASLQPLLLPVIEKAKKKAAPAPVAPGLPPHTRKPR